MVELVLKFLFNFRIHVNSYVSSCKMQILCIRLCLKVKDVQNQLPKSSY